MKYNNLPGSGFYYAKGTAKVAKALADSSDKNNTLFQDWFMDQERMQAYVIAECVT